MFVKTLLRAAVMPAVVTGLVGASLAASPSLVTSAPELRQVDHPYESTIATTTQLGLDRYGGEYGQANGANVRVTSVDGTPNGRVRIRLEGVDTWTVSLSGGKASVDFPRRLPANETYSVTAIYLPGDDSNYIGSDDSASYIVKRATTRTVTSAADIRVGEVGKARVRVDATESSVTPVGTVRAVLTRNGNRIAADTVRLEDGVAVARFGRITRRGTYDVRASYDASNDNFRNSSDAAEFAARRG